MEIKVRVSGSKQELDQLCDRVGWKRQERSDSRGWSWTSVSLAGNRIGTYVARECTLEIDGSLLDRVDWPVLKMHAGVE